MNLESSGSAPHAARVRPKLISAEPLNRLHLAESGRCTDSIARITAHVLLENWIEKISEIADRCNHGRTASDISHRYSPSSGAPDFRSAPRDILNRSFFELA
jgi:hypothetical protein